MGKQHDEARQRLLDATSETWALKKIVEVESAGPDGTVPPVQHWVPTVPKWRLKSTGGDKPFHSSALLDSAEKGLIDNASTVLYLAYGSNLCAETFRNRRGIKPLGSRNVVVPELTLTFDLAGIPYLEPCFANVRYRQSRPPSPFNEKHGYISQPVRRQLIPWYENPKWKKGLVGVVYEITQEDYATIIATEGGGSSYQDILVTCYTIPKDGAIPEDPEETIGFKAHTLYSPASGSLDRDAQQVRDAGRKARPDPDYAQASARYLKLITDGAAENGLPADYQSYLHELRPYRATTQRQRYAVYFWGNYIRPIVFWVFGLQSKFADDSGHAPKWLTVFTTVFFNLLWLSYDYFWKPFFGDGERTVGE